MAVGETNISKRIQVATSKMGARLFRNNRGLFRRLYDDSKVRAGLEADGSSDLIGFTPIEITPDMVGKKVAIFTAIEVKKGKGRHQQNQKDFVNFVNAQGGLAGFANSEELAVDLLNQYKIIDMFK